MRLLRGISLFYEKGRARMIPLTQEQKIEFFRRSYTTVDGLWFMKLEENDGFETALDIDEQVWRIMPKIQARMLKNMSGLNQGLDALAECLSTKLSIEEYVFDVEKNKDNRGFSIFIRQCPWYKMMEKAGRESFGPQIGPRICSAEYSVWAREFGENIRFIMINNLCSSAETCTLRFSISP